MKTTFINCLYLLALGSLSLVSCKKDEPAGLGQELDKAKILFLHAAPNGETNARRATREIGIFPYYNGVTFNNTPIKFPFPNGYKAFAPGQMTIRLDTAAAPGNFPAEASGTVASTTFPIQADEYYSVYAVGTVGQVPGVGPANVEAVVLKDDIKSLPASGKAKVRLMNFSPNSSPLEVWVTTKDLVPIQARRLGTPLSFKGVVDFFEIDPGRYTMQIRDGSGAVLVTKENFIIDAKSYYSIWIAGFQERNLPSPNTPALYKLSFQYHANRWSNPLVP